MATTELPDREDALTRAADADLDVLVVGGGITGAGVALDAALRGYRVALLERDDIASGTSSKSSKLVHGGLRYLANGDVAMVAEGVRERDRTRRAAPHLVRPLAFVVPTPTVADRALLKAGLVAYDTLGTGRAVASHDHLSAAQVRDAAPTLRTTSDGYRYWDARTDDARLTLAVAQAARAAGALVVNHAEVTSVTTSAGGRVDGAAVTDRCTGTSTTLRARWVVGAAGVWAAQLRGRAPAGTWDPTVTPARGVHLVFDAAQLPVTRAVVFEAAEGDGRRLFAIPWGRQVYVGTNDVPSTSMDACVTPEDANYVLDALRAAFDPAPTLEDAIGAWAGLRPLVGDGERTADLSRRHVVVEDPPGLVSITGGKLTTWRQMAQDVVDDIAAADGNRAACTTTAVPLGATGTRREGDARVRAYGEARGVDPVSCSALYHRHGDRAPEVLDACLAEDGGTERLLPDLPYLRGEVRWAVRHELARTVDDVLQRRTRVSLRDRAAGGPDVTAFVAAVLTEELDTPVDADDQVATYLANVDAERGPVLRR